MKIPEGKTEKEVLAAIEKVVNLLASSFVFGYYDIDDIKQQGRLFAINLMNSGKYDNNKPLENFIYTHVRNRYINLRRDKLRRNDPPCKECHNGTPCDGGRKSCSVYEKWYKNNQRKSNIVRPLAIEKICDEREQRVKFFDPGYGDLENEELIRMIREKLPVELQSVFLQMRDGASVNKIKKNKVIAAVKEILKGELTWIENESVEN